MSAIVSLELHVRSSPNFLCILPRTVAWFSSSGVVMLLISIFMDDG